jgi:hypothetical protein
MIPVMVVTERDPDVEDAEERPGEPDRPGQPGIGRRRFPASPATNAARAIQIEA